MSTIIRLLQSALETGNVPLMLGVLILGPLVVVAWRAPELTLRYFAATLTLLLTEKFRARFREMFQALEATKTKAPDDASKEDSQ